MQFLYSFRTHKAAFAAGYVPALQFIKYLKYFIGFGFIISKKKTKQKRKENATRDQQNILNISYADA